MSWRNPPAMPGPIATSGRCSGRPDGRKAIAALSTAIRLQPNNTKAKVNLGTALASAGRREEAIRILSEAVRIEPDNANALNNLGTVLTDAGRLDEAITILNQAVRYRPETLAHTTTWVAPISRPAATLRKWLPWKRPSDSNPILTMHASPSRSP